MDGTTAKTANEARDELLVALDGYSVEISLGEIDALKDLAHILPGNTLVFLNMMPKDRLEDRIDVCRQIASLGMVAVPHVAARLIGRKGDVSELLNRYVRQGRVRDFLVIAGDYSDAAGEVEDTAGFLEAISPDDPGIRSIGIAGYPEGHPEISDDALDRALQTKIATLRSLRIGHFVVTQFSFNADAISAWCIRFHSRHPDVQVRVGVPGPAKLTTPLRFAQRCGIRSSVKKLKGLPVSSSLKLMQRVPPLSQALAVGRYKTGRNDNVAIHFFTFGGLEASLDWVRGEITGRLTRG